MAGKRALKGGAPRMLTTHGGAPGKLFRRVWEGLLAGYEATLTEAVREAAGEAAYRAVRWAAARKDLETAERQRAVGRGRRPSESKIARYRRSEAKEHTRYRAARAAAREAIRAEEGRRLPRSGRELAAAWRRGEAAASGPRRQRPA
jgi:hypothetical protein